MTNQTREEIALFRFQLISPVLNGQVDTRNSYFSQIATKTYDVPHYGKRDYSPRTFESWLRQYRLNGFNGLKPKKRSDRNKSRKISSELKSVLLDERDKHPKCSIQLLYDLLVSKDKILPSQLSYSTIYRFYKNNNLLNKSKRQEGHRKRFSYDKVNALWQADTMTGPYLTVNNKKVKTHLFAFIDDCSRIITYAHFTTSEKFSALSNVFSEAILRRGIPSLVYVDNGAVYTSNRFHFACAGLGITLIHATPYEPQGKGKIERFFRTVRLRFIPLLTDEDLSSIENLNNRFFQWLEEDYHRKKHSSIDMTPLDKYMSQLSQVKLLNDPNKLKALFLKRDTRKVKHDATISVDSELYEVEPILVGKQVEIRFDPENKKEIFIFYDDKPFGLAKKVVYKNNAKSKRNNNISFQTISKDGDK